MQQAMLRAGLGHPCLLPYLFTHTHLSLTHTTEAMFVVRLPSLSHTHTPVAILVVRLQDSNQIEKPH